MTASRRSKVDIYSDILNLLHSEEGKYGKITPTRCAHRTNLPYDRFQKILDQLIESDLVCRTFDGLAITGKGIKCLQEIKKTNDFLRRMGLLK